MKFTFVKTQLVHAPSVQGWYCKLDSNDTDTFDFLHKSITRMAEKRFQNDPHLQGWLEKGDIYATVMSPDYFSSKWLITLEYYRLLRGGSLLVNQMGGFMPLDDKVKVVGEITKDDFSFPGLIKDNPINERYRHEKITISRWRTHWYLSSTKNRSFDKYNSFEDAHSQALKFVTEDRILVIENPIKMGED